MSLQKNLILKELDKCFGNTFTKKDDIVGSFPTLCLMGINHGCCTKTSIYDFFQNSYLLNFPSNIPRSCKDMERQVNLLENKPTY